MKPMLVTVPVYGQQHLTHALLPDLFEESDLADVVVIDNGGDYVPLADELVLTPGRNIGWLHASNLGFRWGFRRGYSYVMTLNNDTRLSPGFVAGLLDSRLPPDAGVIAPVYDDESMRQQTSDYRGPACDYRPVDQYRVVNCVDGTAMCVRADAWEVAGEMNGHMFGRYGWGANIDLSVRAAKAGFGIYITEMSYCNHLTAGTAATLGARWRYRTRAALSQKRGMRRLHGKNWVAELREGRHVRPLES